MVSSSYRVFYVAQSAGLAGSGQRRAGVLADTRAAPGAGEGGREGGSDGAAATRTRRRHLPEARGKCQFGETTCIITVRVTRHQLTYEIPAETSLSSDGVPFALLH